MKSFNKNMQNGYNKFRKSINNSHAFRKTHNTLSQINDFALPALGVASAVAPEFSPLFGSTAAGLKSLQGLTGNLKKIKL